MKPRTLLKACIGLAVAWVAVTGAIGTERLGDAGPLASQLVWIFAPPAILLALAGLLQTGQTDAPMPRERHWGSPGRGLRPPVTRR